MIIIAKPSLWWTLPASFRHNLAPPRPETRVRGYNEPFWDDYSSPEDAGLHKLVIKADFKMNGWMASTKMNSHPSSQAADILTGKNYCVAIVGSWHMPLLQFIDMKPHDSRDRLVTWHVPGCRSQQLYTCVSSQCVMCSGGSEGNISYLGDIIM